MTSNIIKTTLLGIAALIALALGWVAYRSADPVQPPQQDAGAAMKSDRSKPAEATVPTTPPEPPAGGTAAAFDIVRVEPSGEAVVAGRASPGATVELLRDGQPIARETANAAGEFVMTPPPLPAGDHVLQLRTVGPGAPTSERTVVVSIPKDRAGEVLVVASEPNKPAEILQKTPAPAPAMAAAPATLPASAPATPSEASAVPPPAPQQSATAEVTAPLRIGAVESEGGRLFAQGSGPAGGKLRIYLNDAPVADAVAGSDGTWSLTIEKGITPGDYRVRVDQLDPSGAIIARSEVPFAYQPETAAAVSSSPAAGSAAPAATAEPAAASVPSTTASDAASQTAAGAAEPMATPSAPDSSTAANPVVPEIGTVTVQRGDSLWRISRSLYGQGQRYSVIYDANTAQIRNPDLIYPDQIFVVPNQSN